MATGAHTRKQYAHNLKSEQPPELIVMLQRRKMIKHVQVPGRKPKLVWTMHACAHVRAHS
jgi:hypothetical protein